MAGARDGIGAGALFNQPAGVAANLAGDAGNLYVADTGNSIIRTVAPGGAALGRRVAPVADGSVQLEM
jgi:hypothetical protein